MQDIIIAIREQHRRRRFGMEQRKRADLAIGSFLRTQLGWSALLPAAERKEIKERAADIITSGERHLRRCTKDGRHWTVVELPSELGEFGDLVMASIEARTPFDTIEKDAESKMTRLAMSLPVWTWCEPIRGFGAIGLAIIVAECAGQDAASLSDYATKSKVWKRLGLAVFDGIAQGRMNKEITGKARKEEWIRRGYSPMRRSAIWTIGHALCMQNGDGKYRSAYLARKEYERQRAEEIGVIVAPANKIPKSRQAEYMSVGHINRRAQRYMEKLLIRDLWNAWREASLKVPQGHITCVSRHAA